MSLHCLLAISAPSFWLKKVFYSTPELLNLVISVNLLSPISLVDMPISSHEHTKRHACCHRCPLNTPLQSVQKNLGHFHTSFNTCISKYDFFFLFKDHH